MVLTKSQVHPVLYESADCCAQDEIGAMIHTGAAVASIRYAKFSPGYVMSVSYRTHNASYRQAVKIIVNEDQDSKDDRCSSAPTRVWIFLLAHRPNGGGAAGLVHHTYHRSQDYQEDQDTYVIAAVRKNLDDSSSKSVLPFLQI